MKSFDPASAVVQNASTIQREFAAIYLVLSWLGSWLRGFRSEGREV